MPKKPWKGGGGRKGGGAKSGKPQMPKLPKGVRVKRPKR
jgi:hypothetical protein